MPGEGSQEDKDKEKIHSAQLKVYWKPKLSIVRSHGCFKARIYDMIKSEINSLLDIKKINHKDASLDEGKLNSDKRLTTCYRIIYILYSENFECILTYHILC